MMKVMRSAHVHGTDPGAGEKDVDALLDRLTGAGFLDDARYADSRVASLLRQGHAMARIRMKLLQKGVGEPVVQAAIARSQAEAGDADLSAAIAYARKRRFGPFRTQGKPDKRDKELAAMMRRGFPFGLSARIIDARNEAALPSPSDDIYEPLP